MGTVTVSWFRWPLFTEACGGEAVRGTGSRARLPGLEHQLRYWVAVWASASYLTSLCLNIVICEQGQSYVRANWSRIK